MRIFRYYKRAAFYPSLFVLFFCTVYTFLDYFKNELPKTDSIIMLSIIPALIFVFAMCLLSLPIFLNKIQKLGKNLIWNLLTWFLLPLAYITVIYLHDIGIRIIYKFGFGKDLIYLLFMTIPFIVGLVRTFLNYRKEITASTI